MIAATLPPTADAQRPPCCRPIRRPSARNKTPARRNRKAAPRRRTTSPTRASASPRWSTTPWHSPNRSARPTRRPKSRKAPACRCRCARASIENVERNRDKSMGITVYVGQRRGNASSSDFSKAAIEQTVRAAFDIARFTAEDPAAGLPEADDARATAEDAGARSRPLSIPWAHRRCRRHRDRQALRRRGDVGRPAHHQLRGRGRVGPSSRISTPATAAASAVATPARGTRCRSSPIAGTRQQHAARQLVQLHARPEPNSRRRKQSAATPPSARCLA